MYKIIGSDDKQYGPVTADEVKRWIAGHRANGQTMAQAEGSTEWKPLAGFPEFAEALAAAAGAGAPPVSAAPPPAAPPPSADQAEALAAAIIARDYQVEIGSCLSRGWDLVMKNFWVLVGASFVLGLIEGAVPLLMGVCMGGMYLLCLKLIRGERADFSDAFGGFSKLFLPLFLAGLVSSLLASVGVLFCILPGIYLSVAWLFCLPLVADKKFDFWPAMELSRKVITKHWWVVFGLLLVCIAVNLLGLLVCCVGIYVSQPVVLAALAYAYEDIFCAKPTSAS